MLHTGKRKKQISCKFYIMFIIYSVLRNVGPQPVGLLIFPFFFSFFSLLTYLISKHHNVNFFSSLVRTVLSLFLFKSLFLSINTSCSYLSVRELLLIIEDLKRSIDFNNFGRFTFSFLPFLYFLLSS